MDTTRECNSKGFQIWKSEGTPSPNTFLSPGIRQCPIAYENPRDLIRVNGIGIPSKTILMPGDGICEKFEDKSKLYWRPLPPLLRLFDKTEGVHRFFAWPFFPIWGGILRFGIAGSGNVKS